MYDGRCHISHPLNRHPSISPEEISPEEISAPGKFVRGNSIRQLIGHPVYFTTLSIYAKS